MKCFDPDRESGSRNRVGGVVSKVESTRIVLAPKGVGLYCSFAGWIRVMKTHYFKFKAKVKYHSVISLPLFGDVCKVYF